jgi:hypothetical protein
VSTATSAGASRESSPGLPGSVSRAAHGAAHSSWSDRGARVGIAARGVAFLVLGYLVARIALGALGQGGTAKSASGQGVAQAIAEQTGGRAVLVLLGIGLLLYAVFSLAEAFRAYNGESSDVKRWFGRARSVWQCGVYTAFGIYCFRTAASSTSGEGSSAHSNRQQQQWSADVLRWPAGWLWLGLLGAALIGMAAYQLYGCIKRTFLDDLKRHEMSRGTWRLASVLGVIGHLGRAGAFALVGWFVLHAAIENDPQKGKGVDGSARMLAQSAGGPFLLWLLAIGLGVFGLYMFIEARYRKV